MSTTDQVFVLRLVAIGVAVVLAIVAAVMIIKTRPTTTQPADEPAGCIGFVMLIFAGLLLLAGFSDWSST